MPGMTIDFSEVEDSFEALPEGVYECIIEDCQVRESKSSDNPYLNFEMKVVDEEFEDHRIWIGASLAPKALFNLKDIFVALGVIEPDDEIELEWAEDVDITPKEGPQLTGPEVIGLPCAVQTVNQVYNNRERQSAWESIVLPTGSEGAAPETDEKPKGKQKGKAAASKSKGKAKRKLR